MFFLLTDQKSRCRIMKHFKITLLPFLSNNAKKTSIIPGLKSSLLTSLGQIADDRCTIVLDKRKLFALKNKQLVLKGNRNFYDGLWDIPVQKTNISPNNYVVPPTPAALYPVQTTKSCNIITKQKSQKSTIQRHG